MHNALLRHLARTALATVPWHENCHASSLTVCTRLFAGMAEIAAALQNGQEEAAKILASAMKDAKKDARDLQREEAKSEKDKLDALKFALDQSSRTRCRR